MFTLDAKTVRVDPQERSTYHAEAAKLAGRLFYIKKTNVFGMIKQYYTPDKVFPGIEYSIPVIKTLPFDGGLDWECGHYTKFLQSGKRQSTSMADRFKADCVAGAIGYAVDRLVCDPQHPFGLLNGDFNGWSGFVAEKLPGVCEITEDRNLVPFFDFINVVLCNASERQASCFLQFLADIINRPLEKSKVCVVINGKSGCGRKILLETIMRNVLGDHCTWKLGDSPYKSQTQTTDRNAYTVLALIDESVREQSVFQLLKEAATWENDVEDLFRIPKTTMPRICRYVVTTSNGRDDFFKHIDGLDYLHINCSDMYAGNWDYFRNLKETLDTPEMARSIYQYLTSEDFKNTTYEKVSSAEYSI